MACLCFILVYFHPTNFSAQFLIVPAIQAIAASQRPMFLNLNYLMVQQDWWGVVVGRFMCPA